MREPSNIMQNMAQYNQFKMNDNNPLSESEELMPITFMQGEHLSSFSNSRVKSKSHPSKPVKVYFVYVILAHTYVCLLKTF